MSQNASLLFISLRNRAMVISFAMGLFCLIVVPVYFALNPIDAALVKSIDGLVVWGIVLFAGESPAGVFLGLLLFPLLLWSSRRIILWIVIVLSLLIGLGQIGSIFFAVTDRTIPIWAVSSNCTLITCGIYHSLFHLIQAIALLAIAYLCWQMLKTHMSRKIEIN